MSDGADNHDAEHNPDGTPSATHAKIHRSICDGLISGFRQRQVLVISLMTEGDQLFGVTASVRWWFLD
jgi:hypothetical protein